MVRTNMTATRVKPTTPHLLTLHVLGSEQLSPGFMRVRVGSGDIADFVPMGYDQWFRMFLPTGGDGSLAKLPNKLDTVAYLRYLTIAKTERPVMRNYTVAGYRDDGADGPELDIDFVLHGDAGHAGPAADWARTCRAGDAVALIDEGISYHPPADCGQRTVVVADESGLPAAASVLASLPRTATGYAVLEVPDAADRRPIDAPDDVQVCWVTRTDPQAVPGAAALAAASDLAHPDAPFYAWVVGEQALATGLRRHWVQSGVPKGHITFCGYWRHR
ncbi:siderophore-interacting protein [Microbacterium luticocti]|uniref:siderophore-interacting protein n=1 Tax=Microbacterium luticocti TaxID=451764 RepID=UPI0004148B16|nr:siderophore-interacting protein [Microbacterium luticocti]